MSEGKLAFACGCVFGILFGWVAWAGFGFPWFFFLIFGPLCGVMFVAISAIKKGRSDGD